MRRSWRSWLLIWLLVCKHNKQIDKENDDKYIFLINLKLGRLSSNPTLRYSWLPIQVIKYFFLNSAIYTIAVCTSKQKTVQFANITKVSKHT